MGEHTAGLELRRERRRFRYALAPSICGSCATFGSHSSLLGRYQFHLPRSFIVAAGRRANVPVDAVVEVSPASLELSDRLRDWAAAQVES